MVPDPLFSFDRLLSTEDSSVFLDDEGQDELLLDDDGADDHDEEGAAQDKVDSRVVEVDKLLRQLKTGNQSLCMLEVVFARPNQILIL